MNENIVFFAHSVLLLLSFGCVALLYSCFFMQHQANLFQLYSAGLFFNLINEQARLCRAYPGKKNRKKESKINYFLSATAFTTRLIASPGLSEAEPPKIFQPVKTATISYSGMMMGN